MTITRPMGVPVDPAVAEARRVYDAALETAIDAAQERHHIDRNSAWWIAKGEVDVQVAGRYLEKAIAGAWVRAFWCHLRATETE